MKVLVINQCSTNKGDRAVLFFVLRELAHNGADQVTVSASNPEYWEDKPDFPGVAVRVIPWGWDISRKKGVGFLGKVIHRIQKMILKRRINFPLVRNALIAGKRPWYLRFLVNRQFAKAVKDADIVISTGGHHITTMFVPDAVTPQIFDMAAALLYDKPLVLWSQSIGPFNFKSPKSRLMVQKILSGACRIFIRDEASAEQIKELGVSLEHVSKTRESVFGLCDIVKSRIRPSERPEVMGVAVYVHTRANQLEEHENHRRYFASLIDHAIEAGYKVRFFPMELQGTDRSCIEAVINSVDKKGNCEIIEGFPGTSDHINAVAQCRIFVGHKTHSQIFSLVAATPLLAIAYHKKTEDFMAQFGLEKYCITDAQLSTEKLIQLFDKINNNLDSINRKEEEAGSKMCVQVKQDFADMIKQVRVGKKE
ncbi:MAG TPA: polysaccharide pyruvyl transferase family protein [Sedimentisphaerales bacterium]|nr:polysaccharide pyruvyl transferase family protein [Sedimentisphaerales bacterium]